MSVSKNGRAIRTVDEWRELAPPKKANHWRPGRSAMEAARYWLGATSSALPTGIVVTLSSHKAFGPVRSWYAEPEVRTPFDRMRGEPRNTDLLVQACDDHGEFLLAVEAKADEPFGETVAEALTAAVERRIANPRSRGLERIEHLALALIEPKRRGEVPLGEIRYQLLTGVAGAVATAVTNGGKRVVFLVQEVRTRSTPEQHVGTPGVVQQQASVGS